MRELIRAYTRPRLLALWAVAAVTGILLGLNVHTYAGRQNAGVVIGPEGHNVGVEIRPHLALLVNVVS